MSDERDPRTGAAPEDFRDVIGHFATGVTIVTTREADVDFGVTVSAISSLSLEPPMLLVCLNRASRTQGVISRTGSFAVNILESGQADLARLFATGRPVGSTTVGLEDDLSKLFAVVAAA